MAGGIGVADDEDTLTTGVNSYDSPDYRTGREMAQLGISLAPTPVSTPTPTLGFRQSQPGVYSPYAAPSQQPSQQQGLSRPSTREILRQHYAPSMEDLAKVPIAETYQAPEYTPPKEPGTLAGDFARYAMNDLRGWAQDFIGVGKYVNDQFAGSAAVREKLDSWDKTLKQHMDDALEGMAPSRRNAARASFLRTFGIGPDTDEAGNHIPSPFENGIGGFGNYAAQRLLSAGAPLAALFMLPEGAIAAGVSAAVFGTATAGQVYNKMAEAVNAKPDSEYRKESEVYAQLRNSGVSEADAKVKMLNGGWASVAGAFAGGALSGFGFGRLLGPGAAEAATVGRSALARRGIGAAEGAATMGTGAAASSIGGQAGEMQAGVRTNFDYEAMAREVAEGTLGGAVIGAALARKPREPPRNDHIDADAAAALGEQFGPPPPPEQFGPPPPAQGTLDLGSAPPGFVRASPQGEMFPTAQEANLPSNVAGPEAPAGAATPGLTGEASQPRPPLATPTRGRGMPGAEQDELPINQTPPIIPPRDPTGQGEMFPTAAQANPPIPAEAATVQETPAAPAQKQPAQAARRAKGQGNRPSGTLKKAELLEQLKTMPGVDPATLEGQSRDQLAKIYDRLATTPGETSTSAPLNTTVVTDTTRSGVTPAAAGDSGQPTPATAAPSAPAERSLRSGPEGAATATTPEVKPVGATAAETAVAVSKGRRKKPTVVIPEKSGAEVGAHVAETTRGTREEFLAEQKAAEERAAKAEADRDAAAEKLNKSLNETFAEVIPLVKGDKRIGPAITRAVRDLMERVGNTDGTVAMISKSLHDWAAEHTGTIPGTDMEWHRVANEAHLDLTGEPLTGTREGFLRAAASEVERQPGVVDTEKERSSVRKEELSAAEADAMHTEAPEKATVEVKESVTEKVAAHEKETGETVDTPAEAATPTSMQSQLARAATAAKPDEAPKRSDLLSKANYYLRKLLAREMPPEVADREYGQQDPGRSGERRPHLRNLAAFFDHRIAWAEHPDTAPTLLRQLAENENNKKITQQSRSNIKRGLLAQLDLTDPERIEGMKAIRRRLVDQVGAAADDEAANLAKRSEIGARMAERKPLKQVGIDPRSSRYVRVSQDHRMGQFIPNLLQHAHEDGIPLSAKDLARHLMQDPLLGDEMKPLRGLARRYFNLLSDDVHVYSTEHAHDLRLTDPDLIEELRNGQTLGIYDPASRAVVIDINRPPSNPVTYAETMLHELSHVLTADYIEHLRETDLYHPHLQALRAIGRELADIASEYTGHERFVLDAAGAFGFDYHQPHEVGTVLLTNPTLQGVLASRPASDRLRADLSKYGFPYRNGTSVWQTFTGWVRRALGIEAPKSASEATLLDHIMQVPQEITVRAAEFNRQRSLPKDPVLAQRAAPAYDTITTSFSPRTRAAYDRVDPAGMGDRMRRALLTATNRDALVDRYRDILPGLDAYRRADENMRAVSADFAQRYGDKAQDFIDRLRRASPQLNQLMTDVGVHDVKLNGDNSHLTTPAQTAKAQELERVYNSLPPGEKQLYNEVRDFNTRAYLEERTANLEGMIKGFMPEATPEQIEKFTTGVRTKAQLERFLANADNSEISQAFGADWSRQRSIARIIAQVHGMGFVNGDYFPLSRFGNYVVRYGDPKDLSSYGVEMFESYTKAKQRREELVRQGHTDVQQVARKDETHLGDLAPKPALVSELASAMARNNVPAEQAKFATELLNDILLRHATRSEAARARHSRRGVKGASADQARILASDFISKQARIGYATHGLDRAQRLGDIYEQARAHEQPGAREGDAVKAMAVYNELARRTTKPEDHDNLLRKIGARANSFSFVQSLMSPSRMVADTGELYANALALTGARHGYARASLALARSMREMGPYIGKGAANTVKALGNRLKASDWNLVHVLRDEMSERRGADRVGYKMLADEIIRTGLVEHTQLADIRHEMGAAPRGAVGTAWNAFYNMNTAMAHAVEVASKMSIARAAYDMEMRKPGATRQSAVDYAIQLTRRVTPNYTVGNRERISSGPIGSTLMQFKRYGLHMYALMANLAKESMHGPNRAEAAKGLAGIIATHSLLAGSLTMLADPLRYIGGLYDVATFAPTFRNRQVDVRNFFADTFGPEMGELISRGLPHLAGIDLHARTGLENLLNIPEMDGFNKKGAAQVLLGLATGASGENLTSLVDGLSKLTQQGDWHGAMNTMLPRSARDVSKAIGLADEGLKDTRGQVLRTPEELGAGAPIAQALGFQPTAVSEFREGRNAVIQARQEQQAEHTRLVRAWVQAAPEDRAEIRSQIGQWNQDPANMAARITMSQLIQAQQAAKKQAKAPYGLRLPAKGAQSLLQEGRFANY